MSCNTFQRTDRSLTLLFCRAAITQALVVNREMNSRVEGLSLPRPLQTSDEIGLMVDKVTDSRARGWHLEYLVASKPRLI
jgi:hypothetical protein